MKKLLLLVIPLLFLVGCTDQPNVISEVEPWGVILERNLVCTDFKQKVREFGTTGDIYVWRDIDAKPKRLWNDDCYIEEYRMDPYGRYKATGRRYGDEWQQDTKWILEIGMFDGGEKEPVEWEFFRWTVIEWDEDGVPLHRELRHSSPQIGALYYPAHIGLNPDPEAYAEQTPVRWPLNSGTVVAFEQDDKGD